MPGVSRCHSGHKHTSGPGSAYQEKQLRSNEPHKHSDSHNEPLASSFAVIKSCQALVSSSGAQGSACRCTGLCRSLTQAAPQTVSHHGHSVTGAFPHPRTFVGSCTRQHGSAIKVIQQEDKNAPARERKMGAKGAAQEKVS